MVKRVDSPSSCTLILSIIVRLNPNRRLLWLLASRLPDDTLPLDRRRRNAKADKLDILQPQVTISNLLTVYRQLSRQNLNSPFKIAAAVDALPRATPERTRAPLNTRSMSLRGSNPIHKPVWIKRRSKIFSISEPDSPLVS